MKAVRRHTRNAGLRRSRSLCTLGAPCHSKRERAQLRCGATGEAAARSRLEHSALGLLVMMLSTHNCAAGVCESVRASDNARVLARVSLPPCTAEEMSLQRS